MDERYVTKKTNFVIGRILQHDFPLLTGEKANALEIIRQVYAKMSRDPRFLLFYFQGANIRTADNLMLPILAERYSDVNEGIDFNNTNSSLLFCCQETESDDENRRKMPVIFVDGLERMLFNLDFPFFWDNVLKESKGDLPRRFPNIKTALQYPTQVALNHYIKKCLHVVKDEILELVNYIGEKQTDFKEMIGSSLRIHFHEGRRGMLCGIIRDCENLEYLATLGNPQYPLNRSNFVEIKIP